MNNDGELLHHFADNGDQASFATVVQRHIGFVHAICRRRLRNEHAAQEATQAVFIALARKAKTVADAPSLMGWLHRSACYETRNLLRAQMNRLARETEAHRLGTAAPQAQLDVEPIERFLDEALGGLPEIDRAAIIARYFAQKSYAEIGAAIGIQENAARMRVDRALDKLRAQLQRRGVVSSAAAIAGALPGYASVSVPSGFAGTVAQTAALAVGASGGAVALIGFMSIGKVIGGIVIVAALGGLVYEHQRASRLEAEFLAVRAENSTADQRWKALQAQMGELRAQQAAAVAAAKAAQPVVAAASADRVQPPPPMPGATVTVPKGWAKNGSANQLYEVGTDSNTTWGGMPSAYVRSIGAADGRFGGMMQTISPETYKNQRVRLSGWIKTEDATDGAQLWMRVDGESRPLQFDNMQGRAPKGTTDWQEYAVVLDVPPDSTRLNYGFFIAGTGKMWVNGLTITPVDNTVRSTSLVGATPSAAIPSAPVNLGFAPAGPK